MLWLHILSRWRTKQDVSAFDVFDWQLSQSAELFVTFYSHTEKNKHKHLKSAVSFHFLTSVKSARLRSARSGPSIKHIDNNEDCVVLRQHSNRHESCWLKGRNTEREKNICVCSEVSSVITDLGWTEREKNTLSFRVVLTQMGEYSYSAQTPPTHTLTHTSLFPSGSQSHVAFFCLTSIISMCVHVNTHIHTWAHARRLALSAASKAWAVSSGYISLQRWWMEDIKSISAGHLNRNEHRHWRRR